MVPMHLFQIFYDELTRASLDPNFIPLDNQNSSRPDWFEYWPIRQILLTEQFGDQEYLGFFSPRFQEKTGLSGAQVAAKVKSATHEVISFSPFLNLSAGYLNSFYHAEDQHPGCLSLAQDYLDAAGIDVKLSRLVQDQTRIIFSNYFVAKYGFWKKWMNLTDQFFKVSEDSANVLAPRLNAPTDHRGQTSYPMKIFIMERMVSLALELENRNAEIGINHAVAIPQGAGHLFNRILVLDALKGQYIKTGSDYFLGTYMGLRKELFQSVQRRPPSAPAA